MFSGLDELVEMVSCFKESSDFEVGTQGRFTL